MKRLRRDQQPWYVPPPPPPPAAAVFRCRAGQAALTGPLARLTDPAALDQDSNPSLKGDDPRG